MTIPLSHLRSGRAATVLGISAEGALRQRLLDLGLVPGTAVERLMASPAGDPVCFRVRGAMIALRTRDAAQISVDA